MILSSCKRRSERDVDVPMVERPDSHEKKVQRFRRAMQGGPTLPGGNEKITIFPVLMPSPSGLRYWGLHS